MKRMLQREGGWCEPLQELIEPVRELPCEKCGVIPALEEKE